jgi:hypothetical protein
MFNVDSEADCAFVYYKEIEDVNGNVTSPPMWIPCNFRYALNKNFCGADPSWPNTGVELDYMNFYWELTTKTGNAFNWGDFKLMYMKACDNSCTGDAACTRICAGRAMDIRKMDSAVRNAWGAGSAKYNYFAATARAHGLMP